MTEENYDIDFMDQAEQDEPEFKPQFLRPDIFVEVEITGAEKKYSKAGNPMFPLQLGVVNGEDIVTSTSLRKWLLAPFTNVDISELSADEQTAHDKKMRGFRSGALSFVRAFEPAIVENAPVYNRDTKSHYDSEGNTISKDEFFKLLAPVKKAAVKRVAEYWRDPEMLVGLRAKAKTQLGSVQPDGKQYTEPGSFWAEVPADAEVEYVNYLG